MLIVLLIGWFVATHGVLRVNGFSEDGEYTLRHIGDEPAQTSSHKTSWKIVASGEYSLHYNAQTAQVVKYVNVPNFLRSVTAAFGEVPAPRKTERVAIGALDRLGQGPGDQLISVNVSSELGNIFIHPADDPVGYKVGVRSLPEVGSSAIVSGNQMITLVSENEIDLRPTIYLFANPTTPLKANQNYSGNSIITLLPSSVANTNLFGVHQTNNASVSIDIFDGPTRKYHFENMPKVAEGGDGKAIAISEEYIAVGIGEDYSGQVHDNPDQQPVTSDYVVRFYNTKSLKQEGEINLGKTSGVSSIQLSKDGTYVSVVSDGILRVFDRKSSKIVFAYDDIQIGASLWRDDTRLIFNSPDNGLFQLAANESTASTLLLASSLSVSDFSITGDALLFTAFSDNVRSSSPDGYRVNLTQPTANNNDILSVLPYRDGSMRLANLGGTIYATLGESTTVGRGADGNFVTPGFREVPINDANFKQAVERYLQENIINYRQYKLVYGEGL